MPVNVIPLSEEEKKQFVVAESVNEPQILPGTEKIKDPLGQEQKRSANFAVRMEAAIKQMEDLENSGFNPVNVQDIVVANAPFIGKLGVRRFLLSPKFKQYERAQSDFAEAVLREATGAQINLSEYDWIIDIYFPKFGDDKETIIKKAQARKDRLAATKGQAGAAYDITKKAVQAQGGTNAGEDALEELRKRAQTDKALAEKLKSRGLL